MEVLAKIEVLRARCKEAGIPLTQHRIEIYKILLSTKEHPSPEMIYHELKDNFPTLSLATVYNNLEVLDRLGLIKKINPLSDQARYDGDLSYHGHFVCISCKNVEDIDPASIDPLEIPDLLTKKHTILGKSVQFVGICEKCKNNTQEES